MVRGGSRWGVYRPVVVEVAELVGEPLHVVWVQAGGVTDDVKVGWSDSALTCTLTHQKEIIPARNVHIDQTPTVNC